MISKSESGAPLAVFRLVFGMMMFFSMVRFFAKGWIYEQYIAPKFYFPYDYFEWVKPLGDPGMYILFGFCGLAALFLALGLFYRLAAIGFFLSFTYIELIDKTNYLNHYYFVSLVACILIFLPANRRFSLDILLGRVKPATAVPALYRYIIMFQLGCVYFFAGLAKINSDWLLHAQPLKIWLKSFGHWPLIGSIFDSTWLPYVFSWSGALYDLSIPFLLLASRTRPFAYAAVVVFHIITALLFPIGMFPYIMIGATLVFFPPAFHEKVIGNFSLKSIDREPAALKFPGRIALSATALFLIIQLVFPFRHLAYPGELFWHEQGYRFSWRVMLMEKAGTAFFYVGEGEDAKRPAEVQNRHYLTPNQEKMMSTQPDMMVQYAKFLAEEYRKQGMENPVVTAKAYVSLNGRHSKLLIDPNHDLSKETNTWRTKHWILPFEDEIKGL